MKWKLSKEAAKDIQNIFDYTAQEWSYSQALKYDKLLEEAILKLAADPQRGRSIDHISKNAHKWPVGRHIIIYKVNPHEVVVLRLLHDRMDTQRHLKKL